MDRSKHAHHRLILQQSKHRHYNYMFIKHAHHSLVLQESKHRFCNYKSIVNMNYVALLDRDFTSESAPLSCLRLLLVDGCSSIITNGISSWRGSNSIVESIF